MTESTGITLHYETQAMSGEEMPSGLDYPDQVMYLSLRLLYDSYRRKIIDRETATAEKKRLLDNYRCYKFNWENGERWTEIIKATEAARTEYRKDRSLENADKLLQAVEGVV